MPKRTSPAFVPERREDAPIRLLVIGLGNICRSPMAEGVLRARIEGSPLAGRVVLDSAGTGDWHVGQPPDRRAIATTARYGIEIADLRARQLASEDFIRHDWLLCADRSNLRDVRNRAPASLHSRTALLLEWAGVVDDEEVPDPYSGGPAEFEAVFELLDRAAHGVIARLQSAFGKRGRT